ncbi:sigma factor-like helix-turn-helix DNA-binding protein [Fimbriiglobus ruber]|uniref:RNA polymerase sigma-70 region 4 domain-containing protein n=1 Tax=Fimbriiglobus ruber TaxID=1908690 RepID=A0A225DDT0_9BACT|nr:sigma factor-like helix-turn-helix DNA-binding protein [Fimbriiglobus ruber]OWK34277.1 hypothetical protein FRUB_10248 [Fimbriiglobus ruber]
MDTPPPRPTPTLSEHQQQLVLDFYRRYPEPLAILKMLAPKVAAMVYAPHWHFRRDEVNAAVLQAVCEAAATWQPGWGETVDTYAAKFIRGAIVELVRFYDRTGKQFVETKDDDDGWEGLADQRASGEAELDAAGEMVQLREAVRYLPEPHRTVVKLRAGIGGDPASKKTTATIMGLTQGRVDQLMGEAVGMLREHMTDDGER